MGYFSNGTEGMDYENRYCDRCIHQHSGCSIWLLHLEHNYNQSKEIQDMLNILIPRSKDGLSNEQCTLFARQSEEAKLIQSVIDEIDLLKVWNEDKLKQFDNDTRLR